MQCQLGCTLTVWYCTFWYLLQSDGCHTVLLILFVFIWLDGSQVGQVWAFSSLPPTFCLLQCSQQVETPQSPGSPDPCRSTIPNISLYRASLEPHCNLASRKQPRSHPLRLCVVCHSAQDLPRPHLKHIISGFKLLLRQRTMSTRALGSTSKKLVVRYFPIGHQILRV